MKGPTFHPLFSDNSEVTEVEDRTDSLHRRCSSFTPDKLDPSDLSGDYRKFKDKWSEPWSFTFSSRRSSKNTKGGTTPCTFTDSLPVSSIFIKYHHYGQWVPMETLQLVTMVSFNLRTDPALLSTILSFRLSHHVWNHLLPNMSTLTRSWTCDTF